MEAGHKEAIKKFQKASDNVKNKALKNYIQKTLPCLKKHLDSAQTIRKDLGFKKQIKGIPTMPIPKS